MPPRFPYDDIVSIRSPHRSEGRSAILLRVSRLVLRFQSAPPTEVRGDAGCYNQQSDNNLRLSMRDPRVCTTKRLVSSAVDRRNPLLCIGFSAPRNQRQNSVTLSSRNLQDQWTRQVHRFTDTVMFCLLSSVFVQVVDSKRVMLGVNFP